MKIYVFGNPLVKEDSLPLQLIKQLKQIFPRIDFEIVDPNENFPPPGEKEPVILDTVKDICKPTLFHFSDLQDVHSSPISPHDYDLLFHLLLLKKLGKIKEVAIIGVPLDSFEGRTSLRSNLVKDIIRIISTLLSGNERRRTYKDQKPV